MTRAELEQKLAENPRFKLVRCSGAGVIMPAPAKVESDEPGASPGLLPSEKSSRI